MKKLSVFMAAVLMAGSLSLAHAASVDKGKALFESPDLGGGTTGKSCWSCHGGGVGFGSDLFERKEFNFLGKGNLSLEEVINLCIEKPLGGNAIDPEGEEMQDLIAYMKTLVTKPAQ